MAKVTISHELEAQYPEFAGRFGETIDAAELQKVQAAHKDEKATPAEAAAAASDVRPPAAAPKRASRSKKPAAKKGAKRSR